MTNAESNNEEMFSEMSRLQYAKALVTFRCEEHKPIPADACCCSGDSDALYIDCVTLYFDDAHPQRKFYTGDILYERSENGFVHREKNADIEVLLDHLMALPARAVFQEDAVGAVLVDRDARSVTGRRRDVTYSRTVSTDVIEWDLSHEYRTNERDEIVPLTEADERIQLSECQASASADRSRDDCVQRFLGNSPTIEERFLE